MNSQAKAERLRVFSTYRKVFTGRTARVRKKKAIRKIILQHWPLCKDPLSHSEIDRAVPILRALLNDGVFESEELASKEFPNLLSQDPQEEHPIITDRETNPEKKALEEYKTRLKRPIKAEQKRVDSALESIAQESVQGTSLYILNKNK